MYHQTMSSHCFPLLPGASISTAWSSLQFSAFRTSQLSVNNFFFGPGFSISALFFQAWQFYSCYNFYVVYRVFRHAKSNETFSNYVRCCFRRFLGCYIEWNYIRTSIYRVMHLVSRPSIYISDVFQDVKSAQLRSYEDAGIVRKRDRGAPFRYGYVDFLTNTSARRWIEIRKGFIVIGSQKFPMELTLRDWECSQCKVYNLGKAVVCYSCRNSKNQVRWRSESEYYLIFYFLFLSLCCF